MPMLGMTCRRAAVLASAVLLGVTVANAEDVVRTPLPDGNPFPISAAVTVPAGYDTVYVSGALPDVINKDAPKGSVESYGDTKTQTIGTLAAITSVCQSAFSASGPVNESQNVSSPDPSATLISAATGIRTITLR